MKSHHVIAHSVQRRQRGDSRSRFRISLITAIRATGPLLRPRTCPTSQSGTPHTRTEQSARTSGALRPQSPTPDAPPAPLASSIYHGPVVCGGWRARRASPPVSSTPSPAAPMSDSLSRLSRHTTSDQQASTRYGQSDGRLPTCPVGGRFQNCHALALSLL